MNLDAFLTMLHIGMELRTVFDDFWHQIKNSIDVLINLDVLKNVVVWIKMFFIKMELGEFRDVLIKMVFDASEHCVKNSVW